MGGADTGSPTEITDTIEKSDRGPLRRGLFEFKRWFLLDANRWVVVGLLACVTFGLTVAVGTFGPVSAQRFLTQGVSPATALVELMKTVVSVVTIVLSINQLVLSPELGPASDQRSRLEDTMELRRRSEGLLDDTVSPLSPGQYLDDLADAKFGDFEAVAAVMNFDTSEKIRRLRLIRKRYGEQLDDDETEALVEMINAIELFVTARGYLKTTYIRTEFINFSRALLYVGLPSLLGAFYATQIYDPGVFPGETLAVENRLWFVATAVTVALLPFMTLISYISRLATVSQSTLFIGPFVAGSEQHAED